MFSIDCFLSRSSSLMLVLVTMLINFELNLINASVINENEILANNVTSSIGDDNDEGFLAYEDCGIGNLKRLKVFGCEPEEERTNRFCWLTRGSNASLVAKFMSRKFKFIICKKNSNFNLILI